MFNCKVFTSMKNFNILAWNIRSITSNETDLKFLINKYNPNIVMLSETWLNQKKMVKFPGFNCYRLDREDGYGGLLALVRTNFKSYPLILDQTPLQNLFIEVQAFKLVLDQIGDIFFLNMYIHPTKSKFSFNNLNDFFSINNLTDKIIFWAGDFNSKHQIWGYNSSDRRGDAIVELAQNLDLFNINSLHPEPTRITSPEQDPSFTDLAFVSEKLGHVSEWEPIRTGGSDHLPCLYSLNKCIVPKCSQNTSLNNPEVKYKLKNWSNFRKTLDSLLIESEYDYNEYISLVHTAHKLSIQKEINEISQLNNHNLEDIKSQAKRKFYKKIPWWNSECQTLKNKRDALAKAYKKCSTINIFLEYKKTCAEFKLLVKNNKRKHWRYFIENINHKTPSKEIFEKVRVLNKALIPFPNINDDWVNDFLNNLTPDTQFTEQWSNPSTFSNVFEMISNEEFHLAIQKLKKKSPGLDGTLYQFITEASPKALKYLLNIFNDIMRSKNIPDAWKDIKIFTLLKKGQISGVHTSYRPIGIISVYRKLFERIIMHRLEYQLESNSKLSPFQYGFRKGRNIYGNLIHLSSHAYKAIGEKLYMPTIFLDIKNAYNNVNYNILFNKLIELGINQDLAKLIFNLITNNNIYVSFNRKIWGPRLLAIGLTQGGILSPILYLIYSSQLHTCLIYASISEFADDIVIFILNKNLTLAIEQLIEDLLRLKDELINLGLELSIPKIQAMIFSNRRVPQDCSIKFDNFEIPLSESARYLGLIFDRKLNWNQHIQYVKQKVISKLNILTYLSGAAWGINQNLTRLLYLNMIRPIIDFGLTIYGKNNLIIDQINKLQNVCIRKVLSVLNSTPTNNLNAESVIPPINIRQNYLTDKLLIKAMSASNSSIILNTQMITQSAQNSSYWNNRQYPLFLYRWLKLEHYYPKILKFNLPPTLVKDPKFVAFKPNVSFLNVPNKKFINNIQIQYDFLSLIHNKFRDQTLCFTDGSKTTEYTSAVFHINNFFKIFKLDNINSIFDAEAYAILQATQYIINNNLSNIMICSDSFSTLSNLVGSSPDLHPTVELIKQNLFVNIERNINLLWIPSHTGISGNEKADFLTKCINLAQKVENPIFYKQLFPLIKKKCWNDWNDEWINCTWKGQKLQAILPNIPKIPWFHRLPWKRSYIKNITRLRINHGLFPSHMHRINIKDSDLCDCGLFGDLNHILFQCAKLKDRESLINSLINHNLYPPYNVSYILVGQDISVYKVIANFLSTNKINL